MFVYGIAKIILRFSGANTDTKGSGVIGEGAWSALKNANSIGCVSIVPIFYVAFSDTGSCFWICIISLFTLTYACFVSIVEILPVQIRNHRTPINAFVRWCITILRSSLWACHHALSSALVRKVAVWTVSHTRIIDIVCEIFRLGGTGCCAYLFAGIRIVPFWTLLYAWRIHIVKIENIWSSLASWNTNVIRLLTIKPIRTHTNTRLSSWVSVSVIRNSWSLRAIGYTALGVVIGV